MPQTSVSDRERADIETLRLHGSNANDADHAKSLKSVVAVSVSLPLFSCSSGCV